eukprot:1390564-Amorphochlora_amoeboformis.AAC.1
MRRDDKLGCFRGTRLDRQPNAGLRVDGQLHDEYVGLRESGRWMTTHVRMLGGAAVCSQQTHGHHDVLVASTCLITLQVLV